jgi:hypothetical protein
MAALGKFNFMIRQRLAGIRLGLSSRYFVDFAGNDVVFLTGSGRSGTSWVADLINYRNEFRYMFEPFNPSAEGFNTLGTASTQRLNWCPNPSQECPEILLALSGNLRSAWIDASNRKFVARRRLIKAIRGNLMLEWITNNYSAAKLVQLYRCPLAVAASRKNLDNIQTNSHWEWRPSLDELLAVEGVRVRLNQRQSRTLNACIGQGIVIETIADWCINNLLVLPKLSVFQLYYEDLVTDPESVLHQLFDFLGVQFSDAVMRQISRPSHTSRGAAQCSLEAQRGDQRWRTILSSAEINQATELLEEFQVRRLYTEDWLPRRLPNSC